MAIKLEEFDQTIVAIATSAGSAGVAIIRLSGPKSLEIAKKITPTCALEPQRLTLTSLYDELGDVFDQSLVVYFKGPRSLTGEDIVEFQCHGSIAISKKIVELALNFGARLAKPGEFLQRAFLNQRYDLTQVEAIAAIIESKTIQAAKANLAIANGALGLFLKEGQKTLDKIRVFVESSLDFSDEDIDIYLIDQSKVLLDNLIKKVEKTLEKSKKIQVYQHGLRVCLVGPPNAGKSSLLNYFAQDDIAIVHNTPGTTRDPIKASMLIGGIPFTLVDTAGLRDASCEIEKIGISKSREQAQQADVVIYLSPVDQAVSEDDLEFLKKIKAIKILLKNKLDLENKESYLSTHSFFDAEIGVSILKDDGLKALEDFLVSRFIGSVEEDGPAAANQRQLVVLEDFLVVLKKSSESIYVAELAAEYLRDAQHKIGELTGEVTTEDLLGKIFSTFCIGK